MLESMTIRVMGPGRVKVAFYGLHAPSVDENGKPTRRQANSEVAFLGSRLERDPLLMPTPAEIQKVKDFVRERMAQIANAAAGQSQITRRRARR